MSDNFESSDYYGEQAENKLSDLDIEILSGNLDSLKERSELHDILRFANIVLNSYDSEEEEVEEREE